MNEKWTKIREFEDYEISNFGRLRSNKCGKSKILIPLESKYGAQYVRIVKNFQIKELVAEAFLKDSKGKRIFNIDEDRTNNRVDNLVAKNRGRQPK